MLYVIKSELHRRAYQTSQSTRSKAFIGAIRTLEPFSGPFAVIKTDNSSKPQKALATALLLGIFCLLWGNSAFAQHFSHTYRYTGDVEIDHIPDHDDILPGVPDNLILRFSAGVTLVKLTLKDADAKVININFRYNPVANRVFIWPLPELPESDYYVVDWGVIDPEKKLMSGQFLFSAGPEAVLPSSLVTEEDEEHIMVPDYRLIEPGSFLGPGQ